MARLDAMIRRGRITAEEKNWYVEWTKKLSPKLQPIKGLWDNIPLCSCAHG
jgi:transposase